MHGQKYIKLHNTYHNSSACISIAVHGNVNYVIQCFKVTVMQGEYKAFNIMQKGVYFNNNAISYNLHKTTNTL